MSHAPLSPRRWARGQMAKKRRAARRERLRVFVSGAHSMYILLHGSRGPTAWALKVAVARIGGHKLPMTDYELDNLKARLRARVAARKGAAS